MIHPVARLVLCVLLVIVAQLADGVRFWTLAGAISLAAAWLAPARAKRLLRRVKFLVVALLVLFPFATPGSAWWPELGAWSPTREGAALALLHVARLAAVVMLVAILLARTRDDALVSGLAQLLAPLARLGLPVERLVLRILLVLRYVERPPDGGWRAFLADDFEPPREALRLRFETLHAGDFALMTFAAALAALWVAA